MVWCRSNCIKRETQMANQRHLMMPRKQRPLATSLPLFEQTHSGSADVGNAHVQSSDDLGLSFMMANLSGSMAAGLAVGGDPAGAILGAATHDWNNLLGSSPAPSCDVNTSPFNLESGNTTDFCSGGGYDSNSGGGSY